ncbi:hypothetical protein FEF65_07810 [Mariprofundus erugo]|uniref:Uncharacterized protein n=1 Tax=Mariprofundus erugo TaxID=2528639 RepID=A0A5R9GW58_9PROT|nr:hypothetical protein [Mariprofundus erugo]TLS67324.1 hypothetical protein FEF65_07810 [Mariprofundus erugo]
MATSTNFFGSFLISHLGVDAKYVCLALEKQKSEQQKIGELAQASYALDSMDLITVLNKQSQTHRPFGEIAMELGLLNQQQIEELLTRQSESRKKIGDILVEMGVFSESEKETHLKSYINWLEGLAALGKATFSQPTLH